MNHFRVFFWLILAISCVACSQDAAGPGAIEQGDEPAQPPLEIRFTESCGVPEGRQQAYDPRTGVFHIHFQPPRAIGTRYSGLFERSAFEVTKVAERFAKPVVFRLTGVPADYGCWPDPLALTVDGTRYALDYEVDGIDKTLFRVERKEETVIVAFTEKGHALMKPGAQISFKVDTGW
jgi:hypothetical protein